MFKAVHSFSKFLELRRRTSFICGGRDSDKQMYLPKRSFGFAIVTGGVEPAKEIVTVRRPRRDIVLSDIL
jgi:hypothetical protein